MRRTFFCLVMVTFVAAFGAEINSILTPEGLGPVNIGMTKRQAENALGTKLRDDSGPTGCGYANRADGKSPDIWYMLNAGRIVRIDIQMPNHGPQRSGIKAAGGVGLGSTEESVKRAYGRALKVEPHPYGGGEAKVGPVWHYLVFDQPNHKRGTIFETDGQTVTSFRSGKYPELGWIEGCS